MSLCESFQISLSALLDGELEVTEVVPTCDHLVACEECRAFYLQARTLEERIAEEPPMQGDALKGHLEELWLGIRKESLRRQLWRRLRTLVPQAAAILLVASASLFLYSRWPAPAPVLEPGELEIIVEENRGQMTPSRFLEITTELLRADRRYQREMLQVMAVVDRELGAGEVGPAQREGGES